MRSIISHIEKSLKERHRPTYQFMAEQVQNRLTKSLITYEKELSVGTDYIGTKNELNVLKKL